MHKQCPEKLYFHQLTPDDEAFLIHFLKPNERAPLFRLKIVYPDGTDQVFEYPHENVTVMHPKEISVIFEDQDLALSLKNTMKTMIAKIKQLQEMKPEIAIPGVTRTTLQELVRINFQSDRKLPQTCVSCGSVI